MLGHTFEFPGRPNECGDTIQWAGVLDWIRKGKGRWQLGRALLQLPDLLRCDKQSHVSTATEELVPDLQYSLHNGLYALKLRATMKPPLQSFFSGI